MAGQGTHNTTHRAGTPVYGSQVAEDSAHRAHRAGTPVNRSQVAKDTAHRTHQAGTSVDKRQVATNIAHKNMLGAHTGDQAPGGRGYSTHVHT